MKIKAKVNFATRQRSYVIGEILEVDEKQGEEFIKIGFAEPLDFETTSIKPEEKATVKRK